MATVNINGATITAISSPTTGVRFEITLPSGETYGASSINGVVDGARSLRRDPEGADIRALDQIVASFAQVQGPALVAQIRAEAQRQQVPPPEPTPAQSAGQQVQTQTNQAPQPLPAAQVTPVGDTGTDAPVKTVEESQAITTASNSGQAVSAPATIDQAVGGNAVISAGQGADDDARADTTVAATVDATETVQPKIKPRPNILDEFASYTYSASVYLLSQEQYERILRTNSKQVDGYNLLFQTAGAAKNRGGPRNPASAAESDTVDSGRNPYFDNDFYIDSITVESVMLGKGTGAPHNTASLKFTLIEPNGITLLDRLYDAVANANPTDASGKVNFTAVEYLMVLRFYGYDSLGRPVQVKNRSYDIEGTSDPQAVVEKFIPFKINNINWSVSSKMVSYEWECTAIGQLIGGYTARGTVPYDIQLTETTVGKLLSGTSKFTNQNAPAANPGASTTTTAADPRLGTRDDPRQGRGFNRDSSAAPSKVDSALSDKKALTQGLADALNQYQQDLVRRGIYKFADEYQIKFVGPGSEKIRDAVLASAAQNPIAQTASGQAATQDPGSLRPSTNSVDKTTKNFSIVAGQQVVQVIDLLIRNSSYINDQALIVIDKNGNAKPNPNSRNQPVQWYNISMQAERISKDLDPERNDYAYRITYVVSPYIIKNLDSKYFPVSEFSGVHKSYPYWFTGQNTAVLDYSETLNALYHLTISGEVPGDSAAIRKRELVTSSLADIIKYVYAPRSGESSAGAQGKINELSANAAESLYSPSDLGKANVKIVGDPDWIQQGSIFRAADERSLGLEQYNTGFGPDGSISFDSQDILFEVVWKRPNDYNIFTGKADPYVRDAAKYNNYSAEQSRVFHCAKVISEFRQGRFEQTLEGVLYMFPKPDQTNTANPAAAAAAKAERTVSQTNLSPIIGAQTNTQVLKQPAAPMAMNSASPGFSITNAVNQATVPVTLFTQPLPPTTDTNNTVGSVMFGAPGTLPSTAPGAGRLSSRQVQDLVNQTTNNVNTDSASVSSKTAQPGARDS